jgi:hypothetical protein
VPLLQFSEAMMCFVAKVAQIQTNNQGLLALGFFNADDDQD